MNLSNKRRVKITTQANLFDAFKKARLIGKVEGLIKFRPYIPSEIYEEEVEKLVKKIIKINENHGIEEEIVVSGILLAYKK